MTLDRLDRALDTELAALAADGRAKPPERVVVEYIPPRDGKGPRYKLQDSAREFIRMNSNSYLSLSHHPDLVRAADAASRQLGVGPGAVRFIDGTCAHHIALEGRIARFLSQPAARIFNSAYTANCGLALAISTPKTFWIGDQLNHNSIIRAMRIAGVPAHRRAVYPHNDMEGLRQILEQVPADTERVVVAFDGVFSMRGDCAPLERILALCAPHGERFPGGLATVMDDSHGIGACGDTGRGTAEVAGAWPDIVVGTFGKAFGVNGGFVAASATVVEALRQKADTYIYTNPLSVADCAAALRAVEICDGPEGRRRLAALRKRVGQFREGIARLGFETIPGTHPVVPLIVRDTAATHRLVSHLFDHGVLAVGLAFPVVPRGEETIRFQVNAAHTEADVESVLEILAKFKGA
jgi:glycine C-acetyltransferase